MALSSLEAPRGVEHRLALTAHRLSGQLAAGISHRRRGGERQCPPKAANPICTRVSRDVIESASGFGKRRRQIFHVCEAGRFLPTPQKKLFLD